MMNCMIAGVGGQGTVLASKLIAAAAIKKGLDVRTTETIGMAQRGGSVVSHIRMGANIFSPLIPLNSAQAVIAFEPAEAVRLLPYLTDGGLLVACDTAIKPVNSGDSYYQPSEMLDFLRAHVKRLLIIDGVKLLSQCANAKTLNVALLGAAVQSGIFPFGADEMKNALMELLPKHLWDVNLKSYEIGRGYCNE